ncbi:MAG: hypothetical protein K6G57_09005 [Lachnospiraceae bacterium]|nr:hypothetical protein [Lachnospiraceae bacterium]
MQTSNHVGCFMVNYGTVDGSAASDVYSRQPNTVLEGYILCRNSGTVGYCDSKY